MLYNKQLFKHKPEEGIYGDCFRTCIACLLNIEPERIPHHHMEMGQGVQNFIMNKFLIDNYNLQIASLAYKVHEDKLENLFSFVSIILKDIRYMLSGTSKNNVNHIVVCLNGEIEHDPSQDDSGIIGPCDDGYYWIEFLIPHNIHGVNL